MGAEKGYSYKRFSKSLNPVLRGENKIIGIISSSFLIIKEQFIPYTFHVAIQWELDGADHRHLITGGMFSAEQRISMNEEAEHEQKTLEQEAKIHSEYYLLYERV